MIHDEIQVVLEEVPQIQVMLEETPSINVALDKVVEKIYPELEGLEITPTKEIQKFKSEKYGYDEVTVEAIPDEYIIPELENLSVTPTKQEQKFKSTKDGYDEIIVEKIPDEYIIPELEDLRVTPIKDVQVFQSEKDGYETVVVNPIPDEYIIPNLQDDRVVIPTKEVQEIEADGLYDGMSKVTVNPIPDEYKIPSGNLDIIENGVYDVGEYLNVNVNVETGGGVVERDVEWKDVVFIDFDGTPLYSYSMEEVQELTELPPLPTREGFTYQGWNWSLEDIKVQQDGAIVGAHCVTSDGLSRLYLEVDEYTKEFVLGFCQNKANGFLIDWGDGTSQLSGTNTGATNNINKNHTYPKSGRYVITLTPQVDGVELYFAGTTTYASLLIRKVGANSWIANSGWSNILKKVELGAHFKTLNNYGLYGCRGLETINIPAGTKIGTLSIRECCSLKSIVISDGTKTFSSYGCSYNSSMESISLPATYNNFGNYTFAYNGNLKHVRCPNDVLTIGTYVFRDDYNLERFRFPEGLSSIPSYMYYNNYNLKRTNVPFTVNDISSNAFYCCHSLKRIVFEGDITRINANAFYRCMNIEVYDFTACTFVPTLASTSAFTNIGDDTQIVVPDELYDDWVEYTNWSSYAGYIVKESEYYD